MIKPKADEKALKKLNTAQDTKNKAYSGSTKSNRFLLLQMVRKLMFIKICFLHRKQEILKNRTNSVSQP